MPKRKAAMTSDETSSAWAYRMKMDEVETARMPKGITQIGEMMGLSGCKSIYGFLICQMTLPRMSLR